MGMQYDSGELVTRETAVREAIISSQASKMDAPFIDEIKPSTGKRLPYFMGRDSPTAKIISIKMFVKNFFFSF